MNVRRFHLLLTTAVLAACAGSDSAVDSFVVRDSAGIRIAESIAPAPGGPPAIATEPRLDIGEEEGAAEYLLSRVATALRRTDGSIVVADAGVNTVRVYDSAGRHAWSFGGQGDGPGEFAGLATVWLTAGDTLAVFDSRHLRITWISPEGALVRELTLSPRHSAVVLRPLADGTFAAMVPPPPRPGGLDGSTRPPAALVRFDADGVLRDTIATPPGPCMQVTDMGNGRLSIGMSPYAAVSYAEPLTDGVLLGTADTCELRELRHDGTLTAIVRWPCDLTLTEADRERYRQHFISLAESQGPDAVAERRTLLDKMYWPETRGAYGAFRVAADGSVWLPEVVLPRLDPEHWTVLDAQYRLLGTVTMPQGFLPFQIGPDWVLGLWRDELDVQHVRLYDMARD